MRGGLSLSRGCVCARVAVARRPAGAQSALEAARRGLRTCVAAAAAARAAVRRRRAVSKTSVRRERRGRMVSSLCELPAHTLLAAAPRSQPPARARARAAASRPPPTALAVERADLALGYRFRPPLFARARLPARASHRRWSPIGIRRCSSTPHPVSNCGLTAQLCELALDPPSSAAAIFADRPKAPDSPRARRRHLAASKQTRLKLSPWPPKTPPSRPHTSQSPTTDGKDTSPATPNRTLRAEPARNN